jgi:hypothetical protein
MEPARSIAATCQSRTDVAWLNAPSTFGAVPPLYPRVPLCNPASYPLLLVESSHTQGGSVLTAGSGQGQRGRVVVRQRSVGA